MLLALELFGEDRRCGWLMHRGALATIHPDLPGLLDPMPASQRPWVAEITGLDPKFGLARQFLRPKKDYSKANSVGSRGVFLWYELTPGRVYEVSCRESWRRSRRYFCLIDGDQAREIIREEAERCLRPGSE